MTNKSPWTDPENGGLVRCYFEMNDAAHGGKAYNKAALIRDYRGEDAAAFGPLENRSRASIEFKLMNATAAHADILAELYNGGDNAPAYLELTMHGHGYRAMPNYQASLKQAMREELEKRQAAEYDAATAGLVS